MLLAYLGKFSICLKSEEHRVLSIVIVCVSGFLIFADVLFHIIYRGTSVSE